MINEYYGATETGMVTFCNCAEWLAHRGTVGRRSGGRRGKVIDEAASPAERRDRRGLHRVARRFRLHLPRRRREARGAERRGLIAAGDIGYFDEDGFLYLCDRSGT